MTNKYYRIVYTTKEYYQNLSYFLLKILRFNDIDYDIISAKKMSETHHFPEGCDNHWVCIGIIKPYYKWQRKLVEAEIYKYCHTRKTLM